MRGDMAHAFTTCEGGIEHELVDFADVSVAGLVKAHASINQRVVDHDLLAQNLAAIFDHNQVGPPFLRTSVGVVFLTGGVAAHRETQGAIAVIANFNLAGLLTLGQGNITAPPEEAVNNST